MSCIILRRDLPFFPRSAIIRLEINCIKTRKNKKQIKILMYIFLNRTIKFAITLADGNLNIINYLINFYTLNSNKNLIHKTTRAIQLIKSTYKLCWKRKFLKNVHLLTKKPFLVNGKRKRLHLLEKQILMVKLVILYSLI